MALQTAEGSGASPEEVWGQIRSTARGTRTSAQVAATNLQSQSVSVSWVFSFLDQVRGFIDQLNSWSAVGGLDVYATSQGYVGTLTTDIGACKSAAQACVDWVVANIPKDSTQSFILVLSLNSDGSRIERTFSPAQTAGLRTALNSLVATIS